MFRTKCQTCNIPESKEIQLLRKLGYKINLSKIEKLTGLKSGAFKAAFDGRETMLCAKKNEVESFVNENILVGNKNHVEFLSSLGKLINLSLVESEIGLKSQEIKNIFKGKTNPKIDEVKEYIINTFKL